MFQLLGQGYKKLLKKLLLGHQQLSNLKQTKQEKTILNEKVRNKRPKAFHPVVLTSGQFVRNLFATEMQFFFNVVI